MDTGSEMKMAKYHNNVGDRQHLRVLVSENVVSSVAGLLTIVRDSCRQTEAGNLFWSADTRECLRDDLAPAARAVDILTRTGRGVHEQMLAPLQWPLIPCW